jgi:hypothetical protein
MQPEDSSLVRRSSFSIYDLLPILTFLILGSVIGLGLATAASLFHRHSHRFGEIPLLAALFVVPTLVFWQWAVLRKALRGLKVLISNLYWYHWVWLLLFLSMQMWRKRVISQIKNRRIRSLRPLPSWWPSRLVTCCTACSRGRPACHSQRFSGGWRNRLRAEQIEIVERTAGPLLEHLGYAMNSTREENFAFSSLPQAVGQQ